MQSNQFSWKGMKKSLKGAVLIFLAIPIIFILDNITNPVTAKILHLVAFASIITGAVIISIGLKEHKDEMFHRKR
jgi:hypothetical protein